MTLPSQAELTKMVLDEATERFFRTNTKYVRVTDAKFQNDAQTDAQIDALLNLSKVGREVLADRDATPATSNDPQIEQSTADLLHMTNIGRVALATPQPKPVTATSTVLEDKELDALLSLTPQGRQILAEQKQKEGK